MDKMKVELDACPHCGADAWMRWTLCGRATRYYFAECELCGARSRAFPVPSQQATGDAEWDNIAVEQAAKNWNRRPK